jgi:hypothetical protein
VGEVTLGKGSQASGPIPTYLVTDGSWCGPLGDPSSGPGTDSQEVTGAPLRGQLGARAESPWCGRLTPPLERGARMPVGGPPFVEVAAPFPCGLPGKTLWYWGVHTYEPLVTEVLINKAE